MPRCAWCGKRMVRPSVREEIGGRVRPYCSLACLRSDLRGRARGGASREA